MSARGQSLLVFSLSLFLIALMVAVTLGVTTRIRERMEAQMAADAAAYSEAVATARTFNAVALINRAEVASLAALAANQSLISWAGHYRSNVEGARRALDALWERYDDEGCIGERDRVGGARNAFAAEQARIAGIWDALDSAAADQSNSMVIAAFQLREAANDQHDALTARLKDQKLAGEVVALANPELGAPGGAAAQKSLDEVDRDCAGGAICAAGNGRHQFTAVMGTRGWRFVAARKGGDGVMEKRLDALIQAHHPGALVTSAAQRGGAGFGMTREGSQVKTSVSGYAAWAEDHGGLLEIDWPGRGGCRGHTESALVRDSWVYSNDGTLLDDAHEFESGIDGAPPRLRHGFFMEPLVGGNMWPGFLDLNQARLMDARDDFGQPKLYAIVERDYRAHRPDPWNLFFRFRFTPKGATFDNGRVATTTLRGGDFSKQVVLASAIAYYHRPSAWAEPPNLFNPFWRATLVRPDADAADRLEKAGYAEAAGALRKLEAKGFQGVQ